MSLANMKFFFIMDYMEYRKNAMLQLNPNVGGLS